MTFDHICFQRPVPRMVVVDAGGSGRIRCDSDALQIPIARVIAEESGRTGRVNRDDFGLLISRSQ